MKCHYENIKGVGKVLIPACWPVVLSGDIPDCTCKRQEYNKEVKRLKKGNLNNDY